MYNNNKNNFYYNNTIKKKKLCQLTRKSTSDNLPGTVKLIEYLNFKNCLYTFQRRNFYGARRICIEHILLFVKQN